MAIRNMHTMNKIKSLAHRGLSALMVLTYVVQLVPTAVYAATPSSPSTQESAAAPTTVSFAQNLLDQNLSDEQRNLLLLSQLSAAGTTDQIETSIFGLKNQTVIINPQENPQHFNLNKGESPSLKPAYTSLGYRFDSQKKLLIIEGISGADRHGKNGKVVAQHIFEGFDIASMSADNLMVTIVEKNGRISAISKHMLIQLGFQAPVAVFKNLNAGSSLVKLDPSLKTDSEFITRATQPLNPDELKQTRNNTASGDTTVQAGELLIWQRNANNERVNLSRIPTLPILALLSVGLKYMYAAAQLVSYNPESATELEQIVKEMYLLKAEGGLDNLAARLSPLEASMLARYSSDQILSSVGSAHHLAAHNASTERHTMTIHQWIADNDELVRNARAMKAEREAKLARKNEQTQRLAARIKNYFKKYEVLDPEDYQVTARNLESLTSKQSPPDLGYASVTKSIQKKVMQILSAPKTTFSLIGIALTGTYLGSYAYEASQNLRDAKAISYFYENVLPEVLKDHSYRGVLILSTVVQLALIPLVYTSAWALKAGVTSLAYIYKDSTSKLGLYVKDFVAKYKDLTTSQVLLTLNVRFFSLIVVPYWRILIAGIMGQKNFFPSLENGINPFTKVRAASLIGKAAGLTKDTVVGVGRPSFLKAKNDQAAQQQKILIGLLREQKNKVETLSWYLATSALSEKYQLSPGDLFVAAKMGTVSLKTYAEFFKDPNLRAEAEMINQQIQKLLVTSTDFDLEKMQSQVSAEDFEKLVVLARDAAATISSQSEMKILSQQYFLKFKGSLRNLSTWVVKMGERQRVFLSQVFPSMYTAKQVNQDFPVDQGMVGILSGTVGDQADLSKPNYLMADGRNLTLTSEPQINSALGNVYGHLVASAAAQTMMYDDIKVDSEASYRYPESGRIEVVAQQQSLVDAAKDWVRFAVLSPTKADIGGLAVRQYVNRVNTIFASITFAVITKLMFSSQTPHEVFLSFAVGFLVSHQAFGWPWGFIQAGNRFIGKKAKDNKEKLIGQLSEIQQVINAEASSVDQVKLATSELIKLYIENNSSQVNKLIESLQQISDPYLLTKISAQFDKQKNNEVHFKKLGLIALLIEAKKQNDASGYQRAREALIISLYDETHLEKAEIQKLNAEGLIKLSQALTPIHTAENAAITWITSIGFGAILTTVLYSNLAPILMDPHLINSPGFVFNALKTCIEFTTAFYLVLGKNPWLFYQSTYEKANEAYFKFFFGIPVFEKGLVQTLNDTLGEKFGRVMTSAVKKNEKYLEAAMPSSKSDSALNAFNPAMSQCLQLFAN